MNNSTENITDICIYSTVIQCSTLYTVYDDHGDCFPIFVSSTHEC